MPAIQSGKVLVTGANGYIAVWIVKKLLEQGFSVRGTVRSERSIPYLKNLFASHGDKFELVIVPDITKDGAFDEAVKDVDAVNHTASPFHMHASDPSEIIEPAVRGTTSILASVLKYGTRVKRLTNLSSCAAVTETTGYTPAHPVVVTEKDWNIHSAENCEKFGAAATQVDKYYASKTLAERALWEFSEKNKGSIGFDVVSLNPPFVHGPFLHEVESAENLNTSLASVFETVVKGAQSDEGLAATIVSWVDVRDIAEAHVLALRTEAAGGERVIISNEWFTWQQWVDTAHKLDNTLPSGISNYNINEVVTGLSVDNTKSRELFGINYIDMEKCTKDMLAQFKEKGWY